MALLRYFDDAGGWRWEAIGKERFLIGRVESCQICVVDDLVSREHARLDRDPDGRYRLRDLGSRNKTFVNGIQIQETLLVHGDVIRVGGFVFEFVDDTPTPTGTADLSFLTPDRSDPAGTEWIKTKAPVTLSLERCGTLATLAADAVPPATAEDVAATALGRLLQFLRADRGFVAVRGESKKELRIAAQHGLTRSAGEALTPVSQTFVYTAFLQNVCGKYPQRPGQVEAKDGFALTAMAAPLLHGGETVGVVYIDRPTSNQLFSAVAQQEMAAAGALLGAAMAEASRKLAEVSLATAPAWLATLRRMQLAMTVSPASSKSLDVAAKLTAGRGRCGDFCDVIHVGEDRSYVLLTDAGGLGMSGLIQANGIRLAVRAALTMNLERVDLAALFGAINRGLETRRSRQIVTCALAELAVTDGKLRYINAGAPPPLLLAGAARLVTLDQASLVLGIDPHYGYEVSEVDLPRAFRLIVHSDGVLEMGNTAGEVLGTQRLHALLLERESFAAPADLVNRIVAACERHRGEHLPDDDASLVVLGHG